MIVKCLGTGSDGNCYSLTDNDGNILLLDCGISIKDIKIGIDFQISKVVGCLVTHIHNDHSRAVKDLEKMGINVAKPYETKPKDSTFNGFIINYFALTDLDGNFVHSNGDGSRCPIYGYLITHDREPIRLLYITDCEFIKWRFKDINNIILGVDYMDELVSEENRSKNLHIYNGHLELKTACEFIKVTDREHTLDNVIIGHLSRDNADEVEFKERIGKATLCKIHIARKDEIYKL